MLLTLSACQPMDVRESQADEQNLKNPSLPTTSLLSKMQTQIALVLTADDEGRAQQVLEMNYTKQPSIWLVGNKGVSLTMVPVRTYEENGGIHCREYSVELAQKGFPAVKGAACRYGIKQWKVISKKMEVEAMSAIKPEHSKSEGVSDTENVAIIMPASLDPVAKKILEEEVSEPVTVITPKTAKLTEVEQYFLSLEQQENRVDKAGEAAPAVKRVIKGESSASWIIQLGSFSIKDNASRFVAQLKDKGYAPYILETESNGVAVYRVKVDVEGSQYRVEEKVDELKEQFGVSPLVSRSH